MLETSSKLVLEIAVAEEDPLVGRVVGEFVLRERIGDGGFGAVYRAEQARLGRETVVKVLRGVHASRRDIAARFLREARLASELVHPYAAHVYACGEEPDGVRWIAMELVRGTPLSRRLAERVMEAAELVAFFEKLCEVLQAAHDLGIVHRDIKPSNIMVVERGGTWVPKLLDFGVARGTDGDAEPTADGSAEPVSDPELSLDQQLTTAFDGSAPTTITEDGKLIGSPAYMAPEQWTSPSSVDGRADVYSLGACAYQAMCGRVPFRADTLRELYDAHRSAPVPAFPSRCPPALARVIAKALAKRPSERHASALEFAAALRAALSGDGDAERAVYPGLRAFTAADAGRFFGREREIDAVRARLASERLVAIVGPSGAGKSSFVHAGLVPALPSDWRVVALRPGADPPRALAKALYTSASTGGTLVIVADQLEELFTQCPDAAARARFAEALASALADHSTRVVVTLRDDFLVRVAQLPELGPRIARAVHVLAPLAREDLARVLVEPARRAGYRFEDAALVEEIVATVDGTASGLALLSFMAAKLWQRRDLERRILTRAAYRAIGGAGGALAQHADATIAALVAPQRGLAREAFRRLVTTEGTRATFPRGELIDALGGSGDAERVLERLVHARLLAAAETTDGAGIEIAHEVLVHAWPQLQRWRAEDEDGARLLELLRGAARQWQQRGRPRGLLWRGQARAELGVWRGRHPGVVLPAGEREFVVACDAEAHRLRRRWQVGAVVAAVVAFAIIAMLWRAKVRAYAFAAESHARMVDAWQQQGRLELLAGRSASALAWLGAAEREGAAGPELAYLKSHAAEIYAHQGTIVAQAKPVRAIAISADGHTAVSGSDDGTALVWEPATGRARALDIGGEVAAVAISPDGTRVLAGGNWLEVWDAAGEHRLWSAGAHEQVRAAAFLDDHHAIALTDTALSVYDLRGAPEPVRTLDIAPSRLALPRARDRVLGVDRTGHLALWDLATGAVLARYRDDGGPDAIAISGDGASVAAALGDRVRVWTSDGTPRFTLEGHSRVVTALAFSPDGSRLLTTSDDHSARVWDTASGKLVFVVDHRDQVRNGAFSPDGQRFVTYGGDNTLQLWDARDGTPLLVLEGHAAPAQAAMFSGDGGVLVSAGLDGRSRAWDVRATPLVASIATAHEGRLWMAQLSHDGHTVVTSDAGGHVRLWDVASGRLVRELTTPHCEIYTAVWSPTDDRIALALADRTARVYRASDGALLATMRGHAERVWTLDFSPDGQTLVTGSWDHTAALWSVATGERLHVLAGHDATIWQVAYSGDGARIATASEDGTVGVWDAATGQRERVLRGHAAGVGSVAFSRDGRRVITGSRDLSARIWDAETGVAVVALQGHANAINASVFSSDGAFAITAGFDGSVRIWSATTGALLRVLDAHRSAANVAQPSADGRLLLTVGTHDDRVKLWRLDLPAQ